MRRRSLFSPFLAGLLGIALLLAVTVLLEGHSAALGANAMPDAVYGPALAVDAPGDLASPGPADWDGTWWTDVISLYATNDSQTLYVFVPLQAYSHTVSSGSFGLAIATGQYTSTDPTAPTDPWANAITLAYTSTHANAGQTPIVYPYRIIPDFVIRGNLVGRDCCATWYDNGWTELRSWNGTDYSTGAGTNWGGLIGGAMVSERLALVDGWGVEFRIPLADLGLAFAPDAPIHLQFFTTQTAAGKGAYDTVPSDDQSTGWTTPTTQRVLATYALARTQDVYFTAPPEGTHFIRPAVTVNGFVTPTGQVTVTLSLNGALSYTPTLDAQGRFTQPVTLAGGANVLTATAVSTRGVGSAALHLTCGPLLTLTQPVEWQHVLAPNPVTVAGVAQPADDVTVTVQLDDGAPQPVAVDPETGAFSAEVTPAAGGVHTVTATAANGTGAASDLRHVTYGVAGQDDDVWWGCLGHMTRDIGYRDPFGARPAGSVVTLRLRACAGDLTGATLHAWPANLPPLVLPMAVSTVYTDPTGAYEYWEVEVTLPVTPTVLFYKFEAVDGSDADWYIDDLACDGRNGWGQPYDDDGGAGLAFDMTVYDPAFTTPDWLQNAVIYQVFPDRFRNGDPANDVVSGTHFFYGNAGGGITYPAWNSPVLDPRDPANPHYWRWSEDYYGGDLQGVTDQLDYLQDLGVTAIYLNPVFSSPSNHRYDTTDFGALAPEMGDADALAQLLSAAEQRGIVVVFDGVFNHTSSDSVYFDRYGRYPSLGACESQNSPYRDWFTFHDVAPGSGPCVGSDGTPNGATYESWWGYDTLPVLRSENPQVQAYFWGDGAASIGARWVVSGTHGWRLDVGGDVDGGAWSEPANGYWEGFRQAVKGADPEAAIFGEEWGDARSWLLGDEWDSVMNYRFRSALLGFMRDQPYWDNDNNSSSSGGTLDPLTVGQFDRRLHQIQEDYPPQAWYAMVNLVGSHDTNRVRFVLSKWQLGVDDSDPLPYDPSTDFGPEQTDRRQMLMAIVQFTMPGAPTIYYGDEVGLDGPGGWYSGKWEDDPYNRVPFPWDDTPGYYQSRPGLRDHYALLAQTRNANPALRTGSFDTLLVDDERALYAYGRRLSDGEVAVVVVNRGSTTQTITVDVSGYLTHTLLADALGGGTTIPVIGGQVTLDVPGEWGAILLPAPAPTYAVYLPLVLRNNP